MSGIGNGYLSGNMLSAFPFEDGQCLAWPSESAEVRNSLQVALQKCFVDACIYVDSESLDSKWPVVGAFSINGNAISFKIGSGTEGGDVSLSVSSSSIVFPIVSGAAPWGRYVLVLSSEGIRDFCALCEDISIYPPSPPALITSSSSGRDGDFWLRICAKCTTMRQRGLTSIMVYDGMSSIESGPHFVMRGDISIMPGNNVRLLPPDDESNGVQISAVPGAGLGKCPCICEESSGGSSALAGPDGNCRIFNDTCYDLVPGSKYDKYVESLGRYAHTQEIEIHAKCTACCSCEMYAGLVNRLASIAGLVGSDSEYARGSVRWAKAMLGDMHAKYEDAVEKFNQRMSAPKISDLALTLSGMPIGKNVSPDISNSGVTGKMSRCAFTAILRNSSYFEILARITSMSGTNSVVEASVSWSSESGAPMSVTRDSSSGIVGRTFSVFPGRSLVVTYISTKGDKVNSVVTGGFRGSIYVDLSYRNSDGAVAYLGRISRIAEV